jgi:hypothetical protein
LRPNLGRYEWFVNLNVPQHRYLVLTFPQFEAEKKEPILSSGCPFSELQTVANS